LDDEAKTGLSSEYNSDIWPPGTENWDDDGNDDIDDGGEEEALGEEVDGEREEVDPVTAAPPSAPEPAPEPASLPPVAPTVTVDPVTALGRATANHAVNLMRVFTGIDPESQELAHGLCWSSTSARDGVTCRSSPVTGHARTVVSCCAAIAARQDVIVRLLRDDGRLSEYDIYFDYLTPLTVIDEDRTTINIRRVCCKPVWPTAPRDFVVCTTWSEAEDGSTLICTRSVPDDVFECQKGYVRGQIMISGYRVQPVGTLPPDDPLFDATPGRTACKVTLTVHIDLGGLVPSILLNHFPFGAVDTLIAIRKMAERRIGEEDKISILTRDVSY